MSNFFCPLPWIHQFVQPTGVKMCCSSSTELRVSPIEFKRSDYIKQVKATIASGQVPRDCQSCVKAEANGFNSTRLSALKDYDYTLDTVPDAIEYLDLRQSNLCNFKCRTCEPLFSSRINGELKSNESLKKFYKPNKPFIHGNITQEIQEFIPTLKRVNFTGGEPLLIPETLEILKALDPDVQVLITTNGSIMSMAILDSLEKFKDVHWTVSIDAIGSIAEYIRYGTDWESLEYNVNEIISTNRSVLINVTLSAYSVFGLHRLAYWLDAAREIYPNVDVMFSIAAFPNYVRPTSVPVGFKDIALERIETAIRVFGQDSSLISLKSMVESITIDTVHTQQFIEYTQKLDGIRNQRFENILL